MVAPAPKLRPDRSGPLHGEIVCVGRALVRGELSDQNARCVARALVDRGCVVDRIALVDSTEAAIASALADALRRNPSLVVTTGGLGPGMSDHTLAAVGSVLRLPLTHHPLAQEQVEQAYRRLEREGAVESSGMNLVREKACRAPVGATFIPNPVGIAPGVVCRVTGGFAVVCLPGAGKELRSMLDVALDVLADLGGRTKLVRREVEAGSADEAALVPLLERLASEFPEVRLTTRPAGSSGGRAVVALETFAATEQHAESLIERACKRLLALASGSR